MKALVIVKCCVLVVLSISVAYGANPTGSFDYQHPYDVEYVLGWAQDPDAPDQAIQVHFYMDASTFIGSTTANLPYAGHGNHGFKFRVPYTCYNGGNHTIKGFGINVGSGSNTMLANCPKTMHKAYALSTSSARVVVSLDCGGAITQMFHSTNFEDNMILSHPGGAFQCDFRDAYYDGQDGRPLWNPTQASDAWWHYTGIIDWNYDSSTHTLYTRSQPIQWYPEQWGGGSNQPISGDVCLEQWVRLADNVLHMAYKATNTSGAGHGSTFQEFPCMFLTGNYNTAVTMYNNNWVLQDYSGNSPDNPLMFYSTEYWFGACNNYGIGPNIMLPHDDPYRYYNECNYSMFNAIEPPYDSPYGYMCPATTFGIGNWLGATVTRNFAVYIGYYTGARTFELTY